MHAAQTEYKMGSKWLCFPPWGHQASPVCCVYWRPANLFLCHSQEEQSTPGGFLFPGKLMVSVNVPACRWLERYCLCLPAPLAHLPSFDVQGSLDIISHRARPYRNPGPPDSETLTGFKCIHFPAQGSNCFSKKKNCLKIKHYNNCFSWIVYSK